jgi:hypothetical protein
MGQAKTFPRAQNLGDLPQHAGGDSLPLVRRCDHHPSQDQHAVFWRKAHHPDNSVSALGAHPDASVVTIPEYPTQA